MFATFNLPLFILLFAASLFGAICLLPYAFTLGQAQMAEAQKKFSRPALILLTTVQNAILFAIAVLVGMLVAPKVGLGAPAISALLAGQPVLPIIQKIFLISVPLGMGVSILMLALEVYLFQPHLPKELHLSEKNTAIWKRFLVSFYGGINEELLLRWFLMALIAWLLSLVFGVPAWVYWAANLLAALLFGLGHLPATRALTRLTPWVVTRGLVLNGLGGIVFGYLFWQYGLLAAMLAHFSADLVIHVISPEIYRVQDEFQA